MGLNKQTYMISDSRVEDSFLYLRLANILTEHKAVNKPNAVSNNEMVEYVNHRLENTTH